MDIPREGAARRRRIRRITYTAASVVAVLLITLGLSRLEPAAPSVDRATVWLDTVKRGQMLRQVRGPGTLVPEEIRWISAITEGKVERILIRPGAEVEGDSVLLELSDPEVAQATQDAEWQLRAQEAAFEDLKVRLESQLLNDEAAAAAVESEYKQAKLQAEADRQLAEDGLIPDLTRQLSSLRAEQLAHRNDIEKKRLAKSRASAEAQLQAEAARLGQVRALYELRKSQLDSLQVRAGIAGVLQQVPVEEGQRVIPGTNLARVAVPERLKAELRIAETQAKDVQIGQVASIDTRNGIIPGRVVRIDPAVQAGTVTVDVALVGALPKGARPDLSVDGTIEIERLEDVLYVGRPAYGQANSTIGLFRLRADGEIAERIQVSLGRSSVNTIEIVAGLAEGDEVILSDTSQWDAYDRIQLD